ncbi:phosphatidylglycerol lysyltransferase domain-containing protein [Rhizobium paknamense]|uniref:Phosphatidylglycerol lysyltransferase n=1 Tax=Rhizobium paknamense TaxID=1206817 RepID=A0ABU0ICK4_9HYPH|nr:phosphatidylglycerol lysyltransferase domain-containing protein [Rhizobium paknamense]MDQ0455180.1 phosphatidylglycerol lysyltransferase [Rhizobium paknamense]
MGLSLVFGVAALRRTGLPLRHGIELGSQGDLALARLRVLEQDHAAAGLVALGDKHVLFSDSGDAFLMYARKGRSLVVLFDPVGPRQAWPALVMRFIRHARAIGCRPAFYQVSPDFLPVAADAGLKLYKLGDQALVDLTAFDLKGGDWLKLRRSINRAERDGLDFAMIAPEAVPGMLEELAAVSDAWLAHHQAAEKGFSLGTFRRDYVASHPVAIIRQEGRIVAFANILTTDTRKEAFIDLMRHRPGTHRGMMDLLFVKIMLHLKAEGFARLNLGMAPLSGLSDRPSAPLWHHLGRFVFENGERFYNFKGVQAFKAKFDPDWQPRYLAVSDRKALLPVLADTALLIGGGVRGLWRR